MATDFPAAHSMDTEWFAVDADGHVGCFYSGESGAVPEACCGDGPDPQNRRAFHELERMLHAALPACSVVLDLEGFKEPSLRAKTSHYADRHADFEPASILFFLGSRDDVPPEAPANLQRVLFPATTGTAVYFHHPEPVSSSGVPASFLRNLHVRGQCLGCFHGDALWRLPLARHGIFMYEHLCDADLHSGPYGRQIVPDRPILLAELPPDVQEQIGRFRLDHGCFARTLHVQPVHWTKCLSAAGSYLSLDLRTVRSLPGEEVEWAAVDADGHVALFRLQERAAMPAAAVARHDDWRKMRCPDVPWRSTRGPFLIDPTGHDRPAATSPGHYGRDLPGHVAVLPPTLFLVTNAGVERLGGVEASRRLPSASGDVAVLVGRAPRSLADELHEAGHCLGCWLPSSAVHPGVRANPAAAGIFLYEQCDDGRYPESDLIAPYGRQAIPLEPCRIDEAPPSTRAELTQVRFEDLCFAETSHIQPLDHIDCGDTDWGSSILHADGEVGQARFRGSP